MAGSRPAKTNFAEAIVFPSSPQDFPGAALRFRGNDQQATQIRLIYEEMVIV